MVLAIMDSRLGMGQRPFRQRNNKPLPLKKFWKSGKEIDMLKESKNIKEITLAGGCFWGTEMYFQAIKGVVKTEVGYANGKTQNPTYEDVCHRNTGHAEVVKVFYDQQVISLPFLLSMYYEVIDPVAVNRQGNDVGSQYRTGIYYSDPADQEVILKSVNELRMEYGYPWP